MELVLPFSEAHIRRYSRQILLHEVGGAGQKRISEAKVAVTGEAATSQVCALYLAAAGVGALITRADTTRASALNPEVRVATAGERDLEARPAQAASPAEAWLQGAFAAVEALKQILHVGAPAKAPRLELE